MNTMFSSFGGPCESVVAAHCDAVNGMNRNLQDLRNVPFEVSSLNVNIVEHEDPVYLTKYTVLLTIVVRTLQLESIR